MTHLIGVDSGGTHTNILIVFPDGEKVVIPEYDKALGGDRSEQQLRDVLAYVMTSVAGRVRGGEVSMWISAAGYAVSTRPLFEALVSEVASNVQGRIGISNDAVSLLLAHEPETVAVVAGTGSVAMARSSSGEVITRGGDGWVVADYGAAFWLGLDGIRAAYHALEGGPETALLRSLVAHYTPLEHDAESGDIGALVREVARKLAALGNDTKPQVASFARLVTVQAELGDDEAQKIVEKRVEELAGSAARVYRALAAQVTDRFVPPRFLLSGSVAFRSEAYKAGFHASLAQFLDDVRENLELDTQVNGLSEAIVLAGRLAKGEQIGVVDEHHQYSLFGCD